MTGALHYGRKNLLTVAVNNTLSEETIPPGTVFEPDDPNRCGKLA